MRRTHVADAASTGLNAVTLAAERTSSIVTDLSGCRFFGVEANLSARTAATRVDLYADISYDRGTTWTPIQGQILSYDAATVEVAADVADLAVRHTVSAADRWIYFWEITPAYARGQLRVRVNSVAGAAGDVFSGRFIYIME